MSVKMVEKELGLADDEKEEPKRKGKRRKKMMRSMTLIRFM